MNLRMSVLLDLDFPFTEFCEVELPLYGQPVEKVGIELVATTNRTRNALKSAYLMPKSGSKRAQREFFNRLRRSRKLFGPRYGWWHHALVVERVGARRVSMR